MQRCILTVGSMMLSVSVVYLISLWEQRRASRRSEIDGIPPIDEYLRDRIGGGQSGLKDRISRGKLRVTVPDAGRSSKIAKPKPID